MRKTLSKFKKELRKQTRMAIAAAIGFIIAFAWREYIILITNDLLGNFLSVSTQASKLIIAFIITFIGVILILLSSKILN